MFWRDFIGYLFYIPVYEYFIKNLKNLQKRKSSTINEDFIRVWMTKNQVKFNKRFLVISWWYSWLPFLVDYLPTWTYKKQAPSFSTTPNTSPNTLSMLGDIFTSFWRRTGKRGKFSIWNNYFLSWGYFTCIKSISS